MAKGSSGVAPSRATTPLYNDNRALRDTVFIAAYTAPDFEQFRRRPGLRSVGTMIAVSRDITSNRNMEKETPK